MLLQVPTGWLVEKHGAKWMVALCTLGSGLVNLLTPWLANSVPLLTASRVILGAVQAALLPACYGMIVKWFPLKERSLAFSLLYAGKTIGQVVGCSLAGFLCEKGFSAGWDSVFYVSGAIGVICFFLWIPIAEDCPENSAFVTAAELSYIKEGTAPSKKASRKKVPWFKILTSVPVLAIIVTRFLFAWNGWVLQTKLPAYLNDILGMSNISVGFYLLLRMAFD